MKSLKLMLLGLVWGLTSCSEVEFKGTLAGLYQTEARQFFPLSASEINFKQVDSFENQVSLQLNLTQLGSDITSLNPDLVSLSHGGVNITNFSLTNTASEKDNIIDIAFVIDVTGTMSAFIEDAKSRIINFIDSTTKNGIRTRMCISTFGDYTVKKCDRFFDNDPKDPATKAQTAELISEISALRAFKGKGEDPGWPDFDENPMGALVDVSLAPFRQEAQKFVILVTDAGFLYSPQNQGSIGTKAPTMEAVAKAIKDSQITVFGITPIMPGYTSSLNGVSGVVEQSGGEHYLFQSVIGGEINLNQILDRILDRVQASYVLSYKMDDYPKLDPTQPINFDDVKIEIKDIGGQVTTINDLKFTATFPTGRPEFVQEWVLSSESVKKDSVEVWVNKIKLNQNDFIIEDRKLKIKQPPALSSTISVKYKYEDLSKNIRLQPVFLNRIVDETKLIIELNGIQAREGDIYFQRTGSNDLSVMILPIAFKDNHYLIEENSGIFLDIK